MYFNNTLTGCPAGWLMFPAASFWYKALGMVATRLARMDKARNSEAIPTTVFSETLTVWPEVFNIRIIPALSAMPMLLFSDLAGSIAQAGAMRE